MQKCTFGRNPTARCARQETAMNQIGFDDIFERPLVFSHRRRERVEADRPTREFLDERRQEGSIETVEAGVVDIETLEGETSRIEHDVLGVSVANRREVAHATQQPIRNARRPACSARDFMRGLGFDVDAEQPT
jgi:hypothetical protein